MNAHLAVATLLISSSLLAQSPAEWRDNLVDHLAGSWNLAGKVMGTNAHHSVRGECSRNRKALRVNLVSRI
jgi:hypothetical protein